MAEFLRAIQELLSLCEADDLANPFAALGVAFVLVFGALKTFLSKKH